MPVPNFGPRVGQEMSPGDFDEYVIQYADRYATPGGSGAPPPFDPLHPDANSNLTIANNGAMDWEKFLTNGQMDIMGNPYNSTNSESDRVQQQRVIQELQAQASGNMNSQAQQQLGQGYQQARAQQSSLGSSIRGQSAGAAQRGIMQGQQGLQRGFAGDQQMLKLQEQQAAQQMMAQLLAQQQGQDVAQAGTMARGANTLSGLNQDMRQFYDQAGLAAALEREQREAERRRAAMNISNGYKDLTAGISTQAINAGGTALSTLTSLIPSGNSKPTSQQTIDDAFNQD